MPFRRRSARKNRAAHTFRSAIEKLESRNYLTALVNGIFPDTGQSFFEYRQADGDLMRISVSGNITAEFIGAVADFTQPDNLRLRDLVPAGVDEETDPDATWLFSIYVVSADLNSTISIAEVPELTAPARPMNPFADGPNMTVSGATGGAIEITLDGGVLLGALTNPDEDGFPLIRADERRFGMRPSSAGEMFAGLEVAPGNDLGRFYLGGTIFGLVDVPGDMITFYANNILTGNAQGIAATATSELPRNFYIGGDIENVLTSNSFGTVDMVGLDNPQQMEYKTGFRAFVAGRVGQFRALNSFLGSAIVQNHVSVQGPGTAQHEVEVRGGGVGGSASYFDPTYFGNEIAIGLGAPETLFNNNDTFDTAQWLGTAYSQELRSDEVIQLRGSIGNNGNGGDAADYYAVPLLAGQTMEVQLLDDLQAGLRLAIYDPDNRQIATDFTNFKDGTRVGKTIKIVADRPGSYRIAVTGGGVSPYEIHVRKIASIALGGVIAETHIGTMDFNQKGIDVLRGDLGEVRAGILGEGTVFSQSLPWYIPAGNLRAIEGFSIGIYSPDLVAGNSGPDFLVRKGSVGLLRAVGAGNAVAVNDDTLLFPTPASDLRLTPRNLAIGGNYQLIESAGSVEGDLLANGGIGTIRAESVGTLGGVSPVWQVNVDGSGADGTIDLIDVTGILFAPAISTGPNGNVRYMRVGGQMIRDSFFGGGAPEATVYGPGIRANITDDSGTEITLTPLPRASTTGFDQPPFLDAPQLSVLTYPIRHKAGSVIVNVTVTPFDDGIEPAFVGGGGLLVQANTRGSSRSAEISQITVSGTGNTITFDPFVRLYVFPEPPADPNLIPRDLDLRFEGNATIDVWDIVGGAGTTISNIINSTDGEIVNINGAPDVVLIEAETIGLAKSHTKAAVEGVTIRNSTYPFLQQRNLIEVGDLNAARARRGIGNVLAANINSIRANSDRRNVAGVFEGINGPIVSLGGTIETGNIVSVDIGEGILPSGSGNVSFAGLYAGGLIDRVAGSGVGVDIRGDIVANNANGEGTRQVTDDAGNPITNPDGTPLLEFTPTWGIGEISLRGGSIVDADILVVTDFAQAQEVSTALIGIAEIDTFDEPVFDIGSIELRGTGGIIGALIAASDIGPIRISEGFGVINTRIAAIGGDEVIAGIETDGYGIRDSLIDGGASVQHLIANGMGKRIGTMWYSPTVRYSEANRFDPYSGHSIDELNDLHAYLGTSARKDKRVGYSEAGVIADTQVFASRDLGRVEAFRIVAQDPFVTNPLTNARTPITLGDPAYPMRLSFGNAGGEIIVHDYIDGLSATIGGLERLSVGNNVSNALISSTGLVRSITAGALRGTTTIEADQINQISTRKSFYATVIAKGDIREMSVGTDLGSPLINASRNLRSLTVRGSMLTGSFVRARKTIFNLNIGKDIQEGATVRAGAIDRQTIGGQVTGTISII